MRTINIQELRNYRPSGLNNQANTKKIRIPYFDVGEHLQEAQRGFQEIARISLQSSTGSDIGRLESGQCQKIGSLVRL